MAQYAVAFCPDIRRNIQSYTVLSSSKKLSVGRGWLACRAFRAGTSFKSGSTELNPFQILSGVNVPGPLSIEHLKTLCGKKVGVSTWISIDQQRINLFAEATGDYQWIHVDADRSRAESPFGATVAHGFLTLSLLPLLLQEAAKLPGGRLAVNYGLNKVRFPAPVPVDSRVRGVVALRRFENVPGGVQFEWEVTVEAEGTPRPACVAAFVTRHYG